LHVEGAAQVKLLGRTFKPRKKENIKIEYFKEFEWNEE
jgi:hypothetical protein